MPAPISRSDVTRLAIEGPPSPAGCNTASAASRSADARILGSSASAIAGIANIAASTATVTRHLCINWGSLTLT